MKDWIMALRGPIVVLGAGGFVGANLFHRIREHRHDVFAVIRKNVAWRLEGVVADRILEVDITDESASIDLIDQIQPQTVFDCIAYGAYSFEENATLIHQTNYLAIVQFVEHLSKKGFSAFIHAGSSSEYGLNCESPLETAELKPNSHYAVSKAALHHYLYYAGIVRKLPVMNLRLYSVYGPLEDSSRLMPNLVFHGLQKKYPPLVDPDISRDFVYIDDVCDAFISAAVQINPKLYGRTYNIGTGNPTRIRDLAKVASEVFQITQEPQFGSMPKREWDLSLWYGNPKLAEEELHWKAKVNLPTGLARLADWVKGLSPDEFVHHTKKDEKNRKRSVSAIIACYKDEQAIPIMHERLTKVFQKIGCDYEIMFVNDGSPDNCAGVIRELSINDKHILGISHSRNFGSQMAFRSGMELSTKDSVVLLDGDLQDPPELIEAFYEQWEKGFDVIYGRRVKREMSWSWGLLYKTFYRVFALFSYIKIPHDAGDFSLIDRKVVGWLLASPERDLFMRGLRAYVGFKQTGVNYDRPERLFGKSTNNLWKNIGWAKRAIFNYSVAPLNFLFTAGFILFGITMVAALIVTALRIFIPEIAPKGATTIILTILFFGSVNLVASAIVGEYIGKIMEEVKQRPRLIRSALIRKGEIAELLPDGSVRR
jgi:dolichol-phosphate mannosyltransferase